jgi:hypothetical protein
MAFLCLLSEHDWADEVLLVDFDRGLGDDSVAENTGVR